MHSLPVHLACRLLAPTALPQLGPWVDKVERGLFVSRVLCAWLYVATVLPTAAEGSSFHLLMAVLRLDGGWGRQAVGCCGAAVRLGQASGVGGLGSPNQGSVGCAGGRHAALPQLPHTHQPLPAPHLPPPAGQYIEAFGLGLPAAGLHFIQFALVRDLCVWLAGVARECSPGRLVRRLATRHSVSRCPLLASSKQT